MTTETANHKSDAAGAYRRQRLQDGRACLQAALEYLQKYNLCPVVLCPPDHVGVGEKHPKKCTNPGKVPLVPWKELQERLSTESELARWWEDHPDGNVGCILGPVSGVVRLDVDGPGAEVMLQDYSGGDLPLTWEFTSGRENGGRGLLYGIPPGVVFQTTPQTTEQEKEELRFQAKGAQTVLPPSRHKNGVLYQWKPGRSPRDMPLTPAPDWMVKRWGGLGNGQQKKKEEPLQDGEKILEGKRDTVLTSMAGAMRRRGLCKEAMAAALLVENEKRCEPPLEEEQVRKIAESVSRYKPEDTVLIYIRQTGRVPERAKVAGEIRFTDLGNAKRLAFWFGDDLRHCHPWGKDLVWVNNRWEHDATGQVDRWAKDTVALLHSEAEQVADVTARQNLIRFALKSEDSRRLRAMVTLVRSEPGIPVLPGELNRDPWLLNCLNGTLDLRTGKLGPHAKNDLITSLAPVEYHRGAQCLTWQQFLYGIFPRRESIIRYLQKLLGYALTGDVREQILAVFWGTGANGKSTLINTVLDLLGEDYAIKASRDLFMDRKQDNHPTQLARLYGKRLVVAVESQEGARLDESLVKELTGSDPVPARRMREDPWQFNPTHKAIQVTNHKPEIRGTDHGIWRRVRLIPFTVRIPDDLQDKRLPEKLRAELPGILNWLVQGCLAWQAEGLEAPEEVLAATREYRNSQDVLGEFLLECCTVHPDLKIRAGALYARYREWSEKGGEHPINQRRFGEAMTERGFQREVSNGIWYRGLGPLEVSQDARGG